MTSPPPQPPVIFRRMSENPNRHYFSDKYRNAPPICIAIRLQFVLQYFWCPCQVLSVLLPFVSQYARHLYCNTPPILYRSAFGWENLGGCGHRDVPHVYALFWPKMRQFWHFGSIKLGREFQGIWFSRLERQFAKWCLFHTFTPPPPPTHATTELATTPFWLILGVLLAQVKATCR